MIGYYVHHVGRGHLHRAQVLAATLDDEVVGLSSLPRPEQWAGDWVRLEPDDVGGDPQDPTAGGALHWVPLGDAGVRARSATLSRWLDRAQPRLVVVDVSVEVAVLVRIHAVPVVSVVLPGDRSDAAHRLGFSLSAALVGFWPAEAAPMIHGLEPAAQQRLVCLGGLSRTSVGDGPPPGRRRVVMLSGAGGTDPGWPDALQEARRQTPDWHWTVLGDRRLAPDAQWVPDPTVLLRESDVVVTHAGQNALAEVAAARRPAVVVPEQRPHAEQAASARALDDGSWPVVVSHAGPPRTGWQDRLRHAAALDGSRWSRWCDGAAADRFVEVVERVLHEHPQRAPARVPT